MFVPCSVMVPAPDLVRLLPPLTTPATVRVVPVATSTVPSPAPRMIPRVAAVENVAVDARVPPLNVTDPLVPPRPPSPETDTFPAETVKPPVCWFEPDKVSVPEPVLVRLPLPALVAPLKVVEVLSPPAVNAPVSVIVPPPAIDPTVSAFEFMSSVPVMVTADPSGITPAAPSFRVPAETVVVPPYVFVADKVNVPEPDFVNANPPDTTPETVPVTDDTTCTVESAAIATVPDNVPAAEKYTAPADDTPVPDTVNGSATVTAPDTSSVAPDDTVVVPVESPSEFAFGAFTVPAETVVVPE